MHTVSVFYKSKPFTAKNIINLTFMKYFMYCVIF